MSLKNDLDYASSDEDGDNQPSLHNITTHRSTEGGVSDPSDNGTVRNTSSAGDRHDLANHAIPLNFSSSIMVPNGNVLAPVPTSTLPIETSTLDALVKEESTSSTSMTNINAESSEMRSTNIARSHSGISDDMNINQSGEPIENAPPNLPNTAVKSPPTLCKGDPRKATGSAKGTAAPNPQPFSPANSPRSEASLPVVPSIPPLPIEFSGDLPRVRNARIERSHDDDGNVYHNVVYETTETEGRMVNIYSANMFRMTHAGRNLVLIEKDEIADLARLSGFVLKIKDVGYDPYQITMLAVPPLMDYELYEPDDSDARSNVTMSTCSTTSSTCDSYLSDIEGRWLTERNEDEDKIMRPGKLSFSEPYSDGQLWDIVWNPKVRDYIHVPRSSDNFRREGQSRPLNIPSFTESDIKSGGMKTPRNSPATVPSEIDSEPQFDFADLFQRQNNDWDAMDDSESMEVTQESALGKRKREFCDDPGELEPEEKYRRIGGDNFSLQSDYGSENLRRINELLDEMAAEMDICDQTIEPLPLIEAVAASADANMENISQNLRPGETLASQGPDLAITQDREPPNEQNLEGSSYLTQEGWGNRLRQSIPARTRRRTENVTATTADRIFGGGENTNERDGRNASVQAPILNSTDLSMREGVAVQILTAADDENIPPNEIRVEEVPLPDASEPVTFLGAEPHSEVVATQNASLATSPDDGDVDTNVGSNERPEISNENKNCSAPDPAPNPTPVPTPNPPTFDHNSGSDGPPAEFKAPTDTASSEGDARTQNLDRTSSGGNRSFGEAGLISRDQFFKSDRREQPPADQSNLGVESNFHQQNLPDQRTTSPATRGSTVFGREESLSHRSSPATQLRTESIESADLKNPRCPPDDDDISGSNRGMDTKVEEEREGNMRNAGMFDFPGQNNTESAFNPPWEAAANPAGAGPRKRAPTFADYILDPAERFRHRYGHLEQPRFRLSRAKSRNGSGRADPDFERNPEPRLRTASKPKSKTKRKAVSGNGGGGGDSPPPSSSSDSSESDEDEDSSEQSSDNKNNSNNFYSSSSFDSDEISSSSSGSRWSNDDDDSSTSSSSSSGYSSSSSEERSSLTGRKTGRKKKKHRTRICNPQARRRGRRHVENFDRHRYLSRKSLAKMIQDIMKYLSYLPDGEGQTSFTPTGDVDRDSEAFYNFLQLLNDAFCRWPPLFHILRDAHRDGSRH